MHVRACVVRVIKKTWESDVKHIVYFSDVNDDSIPTVTLGVPNTERGSLSTLLVKYTCVYDSFTHLNWLRYGGLAVSVILSYLQKAHYSNCSHVS